MVIAGIALITVSSLFFIASSNDDFKLVKSLEIYYSLFRELNLFYVDETNPEKLVENSIKGMLKELDPYTTYIPESGRWWDDRSKMYGIVEHTNDVQEWVSEYSEPIRGIQSVAHVDGLFIAVDPGRIEKHFNENYGKFHFYDLTFCLDNYLEDVLIGVTPISTSSR